MGVVGIGWQVGVPSGWGTYGTNLAYQIAAAGHQPEIFFSVPRPLLTAQQADRLAPHLARQPANLAAFRSGAVHVPGILLQALGDKFDFPLELRGLTGNREFGVVFFESAVIPAENLVQARRFEAIVTGSTWNAQVLATHGYRAVHNCPQGVDLDIFKRGQRRGRFQGRFAVFSGGKLEYRKGQDLVVAAFKKFHQRHPDSVLVTAWHNPWPQAAKSLAASPHLTTAPMLDTAGHLEIRRWLVANGVPDSAHVDLGSVSNLEMADHLHEVDVALLPSRCEGGTNLVAMECMASGVPVILSRNTGHLDLISGDNCYALDLQIPMGAVTRRADLEGWGESSIDEMVAALERAYSDSGARQAMAAAGAAFMQSWGWHDQVARLLTALAPDRD